MVFLMFSEVVLFGTLGAIGDGMGGKWSQKGPKRCPKDTIFSLGWISENSGFTIVKL